MGKKIPMWQVACVMIFTILLLCYALDIFGMLFGDAFGNSYGELHIPLIISAALAALVAFANGYKWKFLESGIIASISRSMQACLILLVVGMLIGSWLAAGIVPAMIYYGLKILSPAIFLAAGCILCCIVALATGSSWTTAGTIGIALIGVGTGLDIDPAMTAGAVVSGAYFGDKMSPLSDTTNLAPAIAGSTLFEHIRHMIWTVTPSLLIALIIYVILGFGHGDGADMSQVDLLLESLKDSYTINLALLIPPVLVIVIVALRIPALPGLIAGVVLGCIFGSIFQSIHVSEWFYLVHYGFEYVTPEGFDTSLLDFSSDEITAMAQSGAIAATDVTEYNLANLLSGGGMESMLWTVNLIICAMTFGGIMDSSGMLASLAEAMLKLAKGVGSLVVITVLSCIFMNIIASDQYLSIILPGRMYKEAWEDKRLNQKNLSRCLEDAGTITSPLVPWNTCGATMSTFLGVPTFSYLPYAFLNLVNPLVSIFYGFTGISMTKLTDEEYEKVLAERKAEKEAAAKELEA